MLQMHVLTQKQNPELFLKNIILFYEWIKDKQEILHSELGEKLKRHQETNSKLSYFERWS